MEKESAVYMQRALQLARLGEGRVAPNPMVGCVIVHPQKGIVGEGWHQAFGGPHAEVHALASVSDHSLLKESVVYVTLEPCSHYGKTPPCAGLLVESGVSNVVICNRDPNPLVAGKGIHWLESAGIKVLTGLLEAEGRMLNRHFFTAHEKKRPFVTLKWAQTADGFVARSDGSSKWISSPLSRQWVHKWRAGHQAILVGNNTLREDDPSLTVRDWTGPNPIRIVLDTGAALSPQLRIFQDKSAETWLFSPHLSVGLSGVRHFPVPEGTIRLNELLALLWENGIHSLFVEGGSHLLNGFIQEGFWDEALVFTGPAKFGDGIPAPSFSGAIRLKSVASGPDLLEKWVPQDSSFQIDQAFSA